MGYVKELRRKYQFHLLKKKAAKGRISAPLSFQNSASFLILYDAGDKALVSQLEQYRKLLRKRGQNSVMLGYLDKKLGKDEETGSGVFSRNDLSYFLEIPSKEIIQYYIRSGYDYLLYLGDQSYFPLNYLAAICPAKFKAGFYSEDRKNILDFMVHQDDGNNKDDTLIEQLDKYLKQIQKL